MSGRAWEPTMFYCAGCHALRGNPDATAKDERGEWRRIYHGAEDRPCSPECAELLRPAHLAHPDPAPR